MTRRLIPSYEAPDEETLIFCGGERDFLCTREQKYLDLNGGAYWTSILGNRDPEVMSALNRGFSTDLFDSLHEPAMELAELLCERTGYDRLSFSTSGSDAVDTAIRMVYQIQRARGRFLSANDGEPGFITLKHGFHGTTLATLLVSGFPRRRKLFPRIGRISTLGAWVTDLTINSLDQAKEMLCQESVEFDCQWGSIGGFLFEPIQGVGGIRPINKLCYCVIAEKCRQHGIIIIADEITTGVGRIGQFIATGSFDPRPDIIVLGKSLTNGSFPLSATLISKKMWNTLDSATYRPLDKYLFGTTYAGHPAGCLAAIEIINRLDYKLLERIRQNGKRISNYLQNFKQKHLGVVRDIRGQGLIWGIEFPSFVTSSHVCKELLNFGIRCGIEGKVLTIIPNCYMDVDSIFGELISALDKIIADL